MKNKIRRVLLTICLMALVAVVSVGATLAYLQEKTAPVVNTFTGSDIGITLTETKNPDGTENTDKTPWKAQLIPSKVYTKNPTVSVIRDETNVDVYLFVKYDANECKQYLSYEMNWETDNWTKLENATTDGSEVYYRTVLATETEELSWELIKDNEVTVLDDLVEGDLEANDLEAAKTTMEFTAYAFQTQGFENNPMGAWTEVSKLDSNN